MDDHYSNETRLLVRIYYFLNTLRLHNIMLATKFKYLKTKPKNALTEIQ
jgi:hypothetical protein